LNLFSLSLVIQRQLFSVGAVAVGRLARRADVQDGQQRKRADGVGLPSDDHAVDGGNGEETGDDETKHFDQPDENALAYFSADSVMKKKRFHTISRPAHHFSLYRGLYYKTFYGSNFCRIIISYSVCHS